MDLVEEFSTTLDATADRKRAQTRILRVLEANLGAASLLAAGAKEVQAFVERRCKEGASPNTVRKERGMILSFYTWAWRGGHLPAETLLSVRSVPLPAGATGVARPQPYKRWEVQGLWRLLDERWPRLATDEAQRRLCRWQEGRSPYSRVRPHLIHLQLEAIITLALSCGMRRSEIYACRVKDFHPDNAYIPVRKRDGTIREVPLSRMAREAVALWLVARAQVNPPHDRAWLNLWAEPKVKQPMTEHAFEKVLPTYLRPGWSFRRLRDTGAVEWLRSGLEVWQLQALLGHRSMKDTLPYVEAVGRGANRGQRAAPRLSTPPAS